MGHTLKSKHDVIFYSGRAWELFGGPGRIAFALAELGCKVLFCELPASTLRKAPRAKRTLENGICLFQPAFLSSRINRLPLARDLQAKVIIRQIERASLECGLRDPIFLHAYAGDSGAVCREMRRRYFSVHVCTDHAPGVRQRDQDCLVEMSDQTLASPPSRFHQLKARFGDRISLIPTAVDFTRLTRASTENQSAPPAMAAVPRPRLGYLGPPANRLNRSLLLSLLCTHPNWHFVTAGDGVVNVPNAHVLPWVPAEGLAAYVQSLDVGFMPYDCNNERDLHCIPLKMFECFAFGIPVVSTPLIHLWQYSDLAYLGDTADELACGVEKALAEPADSPKRAARIEIARRHSIESLAVVLGRSLPLGNEQGLTSSHLDTQPEGRAS